MSVFKNTTPRFWQEGKNDWRSFALIPFAKIYAWKTAKRLQNSKNWKAPFPVISVGNIVVGGSGKTPVTMALADRFRRQGHTPHVVLRGYGGCLSGPVRVDANKHSFGDVGDEALLHATVTPTWVSRDRKLGVEAAIAAGADIILLDDAHQNPDVAKTISFVVVDAGFGLGNGRVIPAGPLREPAAVGFARADAVIVIGEGSNDVSPKGVPKLDAILVPDASNSLAAGANLLAFAGIGRPDKFFETLRVFGHSVAETVAFPDHHPFSENDGQKLTARAAQLDAQLVTTTKDWVRLPSGLQAITVPFGVHIEWCDESMVDALLEKAMGNGTANR